MRPVDVIRLCLPLFFFAGHSNNVPLDVVGIDTLNNRTNVNYNSMSKGIIVAVLCEGLGVKFPELLYRKIHVRK